MYVIEEGERLGFIYRVYISYSEGGKEIYKRKSKPPVDKYTYGQDYTDNRENSFHPDD